MQAEFPNRCLGARLARAIVVNRTSDVPAIINHGGFLQVVSGANARSWRVVSTRRRKPVRTQVIHLMLRRTEAGARLSASSRLPHLDEMRRRRRVGEIAKAIADRLVAADRRTMSQPPSRASSQSSTPSSSSSSESVNLERKVTLMSSMSDNEQTRLPDFWVVWR
jgi:hypothetical protein